MSKLRYGLIIAISAVVLCGCNQGDSQAQKIFGASLPPSATEVCVANGAGLFGGDYYLSAIISSEDYKALVTRLGLRHRSDLLDYWPAALDAHDISWWTVTQTNDVKTLFGDSESSTYIVTRYEGGRLFFKRHVY